MTDTSAITQLASYIAPAVVVIGGARWVTTLLWTRFEHKLNENRDEIINKLKEVETTTSDLTRRIDNHDIDIAFLKGVQSERSSMATAVGAAAAALTTRPLAEGANDPK